MSNRTYLQWIATTYLVALCLPAFGRDHEETPGIACLAWMPWVLMFPAWYANPALGVGCVLLARRDRGAFACGVVATLLAGSFALMMGADGLRVGYFAWLACMVLLAIAGSGRFGASRRLGKPRVREIDWGEEDVSTLEIDPKSWGRPL